MHPDIYNSYMEIDFRIMEKNLEKVRKHLGGKEIIPVIKCNAYGFGIGPMARFYVERQNAGILAVSQLVEAFDVRNAGLTDVDILIMGGVLGRQIPYAVECGAQIALYDTRTAERLSEAARARNKRAAVHVKIETGLERIGVRPGAPLEALLDRIEELGNIEIVCTFSHFSNAELIDDPTVMKQFDAYKQATAQVERRDITLDYKHISDTGAASWFQDDYCTHIRSGSFAVGLASMLDYSNPFNIEDAMSWRAYITRIAELVPGETCGYCGHFTADCPMTVATINVGYGDGVYRPVANSGGPVIAKDVRTRFLAVCMDQSMIDVTGLGCEVGDEVTILGASRGGTIITANEFAELSGVPFSFPIFTIGSRVKRIYHGM